MTKNTVNETERMVVTRVFDAPRALVWEAWTNPKYVMQWWVTVAAKNWSSLAVEPAGRVVTLCSDPGEMRS